MRYSELSARYSNVYASNSEMLASPCILPSPLLVTGLQKVSSPNRNRRNGFFSYLTLFVLIFLFGCAPLVPYPPTPPFSQKEAARLIARLKTQGDEVTSFQGLGKLRFKEGEQESEANLLAVGSRPFRVRLEISHPWGKPLFFVVANNKYTQAVSFVEKKVFRGEWSRLPVRPFSVLTLDLNSLWMVLSGGVPILPHARAASLKQHEIRLFDEQEEVREIIAFFPDSRLPRSVYFPDRGITIVFSDYEHSDWGLKPSGITIMSEVHNQSAEIRYKHLRINRSVPEEVFHLALPPGFEIVDLSP
jgi:hypothetical protein